MVAPEMAQGHDFFAPKAVKGGVAFLIGMMKAGEIGG